jgi:hypothetical protein
MGRAFGTNGEKRNACKILTGMLDENKPNRRISCKWVLNIDMELREIRWCGKDWIDLAQVRVRRKALVNTVMNPSIPYAVKFFKSCATDSF